MIDQAVSFLSQFAVNLIDKSGYVGVFVLSALESAAIPIPSEIVLPFSGFLAVSGRFSFWAIISLATAANLFGSVILFYLGRFGGRWILEKYGKYIFIHQRDIDAGDRWFSKYGAKAVFWSRMLPVVRTFISLPAGISEMRISKFAMLTVLGSLPWNFALATVGYKAGENWGLLHDYFKKFDMVIVLIIVGLVIWYGWKYKKRR